MQTNNRHVRSLLVVPVFFLFGLGAALGAHQAAAPQAQAPQVQAPATDAVAGVRNFTRVDATMACGGAVTAGAYAALKQAGFASVVNLRDESEAGVDLDVDRKAAEDAGLKYFHLPFVASSPDAAKLDEFLKLVAAPQNQPMMLHCASGGRASMFWAVKRVMIDGWPADKAMNELPALSKNVPQPVRTFMLDYLKSHGKGRP
jgi:uncharacterized protein (TIGR01244 family)